MLSIHIFAMIDEDSLSKTLVWVFAIIITVNTKLTLFSFKVTSFQQSCHIFPDSQILTVAFDNFFLLECIIVKVA